MKKMMFVLLLVILSGCFNQKTEKTSCGAEEFYKEYWSYLMETYPTWASSKGWGERHDQIFESTIENINKTHEMRKKHLAKVNAFLNDKVCDAEKMNLSLLQLDLEKSIEGHQYNEHLVPFESMSGPHIMLPQLYKRVPLKTLQNYKDYLSRMKKVSKVFEQNMTLAKMGLAKKITPPQVTFKGYESSMLDLTKGDSGESPYFTPFKKFPDNFSDLDKKALVKEAKEVITSQIQPAYKKLYDFWVNDYYPHLRKTIAAEDLPNGKSFYKHKIKSMTTLNKTADEIHNIGLSEVSRILNEMKEIKNKVNFKGDLKAFFKELRENPIHYAKTETELLDRTSVILKEMDGKMPKLFKVLPMLTYTVEPIPSFIAHKSPAAYYNGGDMKIGKAGTYQLNTSNLKSRPLYNLTALSLHEAVPGHHLQIALAQEMKNVPEFRKNLRYTAFTEGWGLYSESLGKDVGMYKTPYDDFGRLNYEQWRAMRLVVDTGMHSKGWSRDKAISFMKENSGLSEKNIITEVDRYINWPGQALAYKMGELKIKELRAKSKKELGDKFNIRDFHDVVLGNGTVPLPVLEANVEKYIKEMK